MKKDLLTAKEVSEFLRIPLSTIYRLSKIGKINAVKVGKHWRYRKDDVENLLASGTDFSDISPGRAGETQECRHASRKYPRLNCHFLSEYRVFIESVKRIESTGVIRNISGAGLLLEPTGAGFAGMTAGKQAAEPDIDTDDPIELKFEFTGEDGRRIVVEVSGRVVRRAQRGLGIKFRNIRDDVRNEIIRYVG